MNNKDSKIILIDLDKILFHSDLEYDSPVLRANQQMDEENAIEVKELQKHTKVVAFYPAYSKISSVIEKRLVDSGFDFFKTIIAEPEVYAKTKKKETLNLMKEHQILCVVDETGDEIWNQMNLSRLKF